MVTKETDPETPLRAMAFRQALAKLGWSEGRNVVVDFRFGTGDLNRFRAQAKELTGVTPDIIMAESTPAALALRQETSAVPIHKLPAVYFQRGLDNNLHFLDSHLWIRVFGIEIRVSREAMP